MGKESKKAKEAQDLRDAHDNYLNTDSAKIKNIYIELPGYEYFHSPSGISRKDKRLIGREAVKQKLRTILRNSKTKAGAYLVTGYRGMGKTSLVRAVIAGLKEDDSKEKVRKGLVKGEIGLVAFLVFVLTWLSLVTIGAKYWEGPFVRIGAGFESPFAIFIAVSAFCLGLFVCGLLCMLFGLGVKGKLYAEMAEPPRHIIFPKSNAKRKELYQRLWMWVVPKSAKEQILEVETSLSQDQIKELDFLKLLAKNLEKAYSDFCKPFFSYLRLLRHIRNILLGAILFLFIYPAAQKYYYEINLQGIGQEVADVDTKAKQKLMEQDLGIFHPYFRPIFFVALLASYILLIIILRKLMSRFLRRIGFVTDGEVRARLHSLIEKIDATVSLQNSQDFSPNVSRIGVLNFGRVKTHNYPMAGVKEIEFGIIDILDGIDRIKEVGGYKPQFICVFDELDKIQLNYAPGTFDEENETDLDVDRDIITRRLRERREKISSILANLKHFLNVAKAKFVFIAGREMFDASLADISDRDFFLGSIFHEIVYVESFLKDRTSPKASGVTNMIERYLCQFLMGFPPLPQKNGEYELVEDRYEDLNLKRYYEWVNEDRVEIDRKIKRKANEVYEHKSMIKEAGKKINELACNNQAFVCEKRRPEDQIKSHVKIIAGLEDEIIRLDQEALATKGLQKTISVLQNFIIYLVYRSNGTPKKITSLLEKYIKELRVDPATKDPLSLSSKRDIILRTPLKPPTLTSKIENARSKECEPFPIEDKKHSFFLCFDYDTQYQFGLISYLFRPYLIAKSQFMKSLGDKLLFSTAFLADHLFKFHPWAFSWRTLELTPELVFASKSPQLRAFIGTLMGSLLRTHIREIVYGVFEFKFYNKTRHEISYISKIKEEESAAFNFTLDESMHIKVHFQKRLKKLFKEYGTHPARVPGDYFQSLPFLHSTLGDIFFYDQEYDEALLSYSEAVAIYRQGFGKDFSPHQLTNWMKDRLKMGLTYEKMHSNSDALSVYEGILMDLDNFLGLGDDDRDAFPEGARHARYAKTLFENLRFFQLPFVAKLVVIEKEGISGISYMDIVDSERRMRRLLRVCLEKKSEQNLLFLPQICKQQPMKTQEFLVRVYYHLNVGAVLYFKNGSVLHAFDELGEDDKKIWGKLEKFLLPGDPNRRKFNVPRSATMEYYKAFLFLVARLQAFSKKRTHNVRRKLDLSPKEIESEAIGWISEEIGDNIKILTTIPKPSELERQRKVIFSRINKYLGNGNPVYFIFASSVWFFLLDPYESRYINQDNNLLSTIATMLSKLGDVLLCYIDKKTEFSLKKWEYLFEVQNVLLQRSAGNEDNFKEDTDTEKNKAPIELNGESNEDLIYFVAFFYMLSSMYFLKAGKHQNHEFQLRKILYLVKDYLSFGVRGKEKADGKRSPVQITRNNSKIFRDLLIKELVRPCLKAITWENEVTNRPQTFKYISIFGDKGTTNDYESKVIYNFVSNSQETREVTLLMAKIELKLWSRTEKGGRDAALEDIAFRLDKNFINPYSHYSSKFVRIQELMFKAQCNFALLFKIEDFSKLPKIENGDEWQEASKAAKGMVLHEINETAKRPNSDILELIRHFRCEETHESLSYLEKPFSGIAKLELLISESLFCTIEAIKILNIFGINYMTSHSYLGYCHQKLGDWCLLYKAYLSYLSGDAKKRFEDEIVETAEASNIVYLEPKYHYELAVMNFYSAREIHNNGKGYSHQIEQMYFLEDDFNDNLYHFTAALERYKFNSGAIDEKVKPLKAFMNLTKTFDYSAYINTCEEGDEERGNPKGGIQPDTTPIDSRETISTDDVESANSAPRAPESPPAADSDPVEPTP